MGHLIRFDWALKNILRNKANFEILEGFLSELIKEDIKIETMLDTESNKDTADDKSNRVDMLVKNSNGELMLIEVQNRKEYDYFHRMIYGASKLITEYINEGEKYHKIKKVISVNIVYFDLGQGQDYVYHGTTKFIGLHRHDELKLTEKQIELYKKEKIEQIYPEYYLLKVNQFDDIAKDRLDEWIYFLKNDDIKKEFKAKGIRKAEKALDILKLSTIARKKYERYIDNQRCDAGITETMKIDREDEIRKEERTQGEQIGIEKGELKKAIETAKKMKLKNLPIELIMEITGLSIKEIEAL